MRDPIIWVSSFEMKTQNIKSIDWHLNRPRIDFIHEIVDEHIVIDPASAPEYAYFGLRDIPAKKRNNLPDLLIIRGGIFFVSEAFRNLLMRFDLGQTQFFEVPLYEYDQKTQRPGRWFFLNIAEIKDTLAPETCEGLEEYPKKEGYFSVRSARTLPSLRCAPRRPWGRICGAKNGLTIACSSPTG